MCRQPSLQQASGRFPIGRYLWSTLAVGITLALYLTSFGSLPHDVFWANDEGGKFLQTASWQIGRTPTYTFRYPGAATDPELTFYPRGHVFPRRTPDDTIHLGWQPWFSLLSALPYRWLGQTGLYIIPLFAGLATVFLCGAMARRLHKDAGAPAIILAGWASPLLFYSQLFWEHTAATCAGFAGAWMLWSSIAKPARRVRSLVGSITLLTLAVAFRHEMITYCLAVIVAALLAGRQHRRPGARPSFAPPLRAVLLTGAALLGLGSVMAILFQLLPQRLQLPFYSYHFTGAVNRFLQLDTWLSLPQVTGHVLINNTALFGPRIPALVLSCGSAGLALCLSSCLCKPPRKTWLWLCGAGLLLTPSLYALLYAEDFSCVHSLFLPAPWMALALLPARHHQETRPFSLFVGWLAGLYVAFHIVVALLTQRSHGGAEWGSRFLLTAYPLFAVVAARRLVLWLNQSKAMRQQILTTLMAGILLVTSCAFTLRGVRELQASKRIASVLGQAFEEQSAPIITDLQWLPAFIAPTFAENEIYTISTLDQLAECLMSVAKHSDRMTFISLAELHPTDIKALPVPLEIVERRAMGRIRFTTYQVMHRPTTGETTPDAH